MSRSLDSWYSLPELDVLAGREAAIEGALELARLTRLTELLNADGGSVRVRLQFRQLREDCVILDLRCNVQLELLCQRCLEPARHDADVDVRYGLLEEGADDVGLPDELETFVLDGDRFNPARLIEDELIVSLPLVARHADQNDCGRLARELDELDRRAGRTTDKGTDGSSARA